MLSIVMNRYMYQKLMCPGMHLMLLSILTMLPSLVESLAQYHDGVKSGWCMQPSSCTPLLRLVEKRKRNNCINWTSVRRRPYLMVSSESFASSEPSKNVAELFQDSDRFERWRFLQQLLEGDADAHVVNRLLYQVLEGAIKYPRKNESGDWVLMPAEIKTSIEVLLYSEDCRNKDGHIIILHENYEDQNVQEVARQALNQLEALLPTSDEDEDAVKSLWDTVMEVHGREAVKYQETQDNSLEWKLRNTVARLLLHHDFLTLGVVHEPLQ
jgi:hypothetical protein